MTDKNKTKIELLSEVKKLQKKLQLLEQKNKKTLSKSPEKRQESIDSKWDSYFNNSEHTILVVDKKGVIIDNNDVLNSPERDKVIGKSALTFIDKEYHSLVKKTLKTVFATGTPQRYEISGIEKTGQKLFYSSRITPHFENDKVVSAIIDVVEITEVVNTKRELEQSEEKFKKLSDSAFEGVAIHKDGKVIEVNNALRKTFQYSDKELLNQPILKFIHPDYHKIVLENIKNKIETPYEVKMIRKGNMPFWAELIGTQTNYKGEPARVTSIRDITKYKENEQRITESEENHKYFLQQIPSGVIIYVDNKVVFANKAAFEILGLKHQDLDKVENLTVFDYILPKYRKEVSDRRDRILNGESLGFFEIEIKTPGGETVDIEIKSKAVSHNGKMGVQTIFNNISFRKKAEKILKENERVLSALLNQLPGMAYRCDYNKKWTMRFVSKGAFAITGYKPIDLIDNFRTAFSCIIYPGDRSAGKIKKSIKEQKPYELEYRIIKANGEVKWVLEKGEGVFSDKGKLLFLEGFILDIDETKRYEFDLKQSRENYKNLVNFSPIGIFIHIDGKVVFANPNALSVMEIISFDELKNKTIFDYLLPEYHASILERMQATTSPKHQPFREIKAKTAKGNIVELETQVVRIKYDGKEAVQVIMYKTGPEKQLAKEKLRAQIAEETNVKLQKEITERKTAEKLLQSTQKYARLLIDSSLDMICATDKNGCIIEFNTAAQKTFGYKSEEIIGEHVNLLYKNAEERSRITDNELYTKGTYSGEVTNVRKNGEPFTAFLSASLLINEEGDIIGAMGVSRDISNLKKDEQKLRESEERYRDLFENATDLIQSIDANGKIMYVNAAWKNTMGFSDKELAEKTIFDIIHPESIGHCSVLFAQIMQGQNAENVEITFVSKEGRPVICEGNISCRFEKNIPVSTRGIFRDVTVSHLISKQIKESEERYRAIYNQAFIGIAQVSLKGEFMQVNEHLCNIVGYSKEELCKKTFVDITIPGDIDKSLDVRNKVINGEIDKATFEKRYIHKSGKIVHINLTLSIVKDADGKPVYFISVFQDITERLKSESEKQKQSAKLNAIFESSSHVIWTIDKSFCLTAFNKNFIEHMRLRYGLEPALGFSMIEGNAISNKEYNDFWIGKYTQVFKGIPQNFETKFIDKNNEIVWRDIYLNPIFNDKKNVIEVSGIAHDITEKKLSDEKIRQSLQEKEILLKEVHHRVKNNLQVISSILNLQSSYVKDPGTLTILKESQNRIKSMAFIHESLYQNKDFSSVNFSEYIQNLSRNLIHSYANFDEIKLNLDIQNVFLNLDLAIPCGLIINEVVSNALKYAFNGIEGDKEINMSMVVQDENLIIKIGDNGVGLPSHIDFRNTESLGLQLVVTLTDQLNGSIELDTSIGTVYTIIFKHNQIKNRI